MLTALITKGKFDGLGPYPDQVNVENDYDIIYYVYDDTNQITTEKLTWELYKKPAENNNYSLVATNQITGGLIQLNLNNYGLQYEDNKYLLKTYLYKNGFSIGEAEFWYYFNTYTRIPKRTPWFSGLCYLQYQGGGGVGGAIMPIIREKDIPDIEIKEIKEKESDFEITILNLIENEK